jgi:RNA polymerase sigma factor (sigma-70 family)
VSTDLSDVILRYVRRLGETHPEAQASDNELLGRYLGRRDEAAFAALVHRHGPMVLGTARRVLHNPHDAADVFQAVFLTLVRRAASIRKRESVGSWLYGTAYRLASKARARAVREGKRLPAAAGPAVPGPLETLTVRELFAALDEELQGLPDKYRAPLLLCYLEERTQDEAARRLAWPLATLRHRLKRGRELLAARLARRGMTLSAAPLAVGLTAATSPAQVPGDLLLRTVQAALAGNSGPAAGVVSAGALALVQECARATRVSRALVLLALMTALGGLAAGAAWALYPGEPPAQRETGARAPAPPGKADEDKAPADPLPPGAMARLGTVRLRHAGPVTVVAFSPDHTRLASGGDDGTIRLWEAATAKELQRLGGHVMGVRCLAFSPDGKMLASGSGGAVIRLWDLAAGKERRPFQGHQEEKVFKDEGGMYALAFSPDGRTLASSSHHDLALYLWDVKTGKGRKLPEPACGSALLAFSPDGKCLASAEREALRMWTASGKLLSSVGAPNDTVGLSFDDEGDTVITTTYRGTVHLRDRTTLREKRKLQAPAGIQAATLSADGKILALAYPDYTIRLWDLGAGRERRSLRGHRQEVLHLAFAADGKTLASAGFDHTVRLWETATGKERVALPGHQGRVLSIAFARDPNLLASFGRDQVLRLWDRASGKELLCLGEEERFLAAALSPDGKMVAGAARDGSVRLWDAGTGKEVRRLAGSHPSVQALAFSPDGRTLAAAGGDAGSRVTAWDPGTGKGLWETPLADAGLETVAFSPDGKTVAAAGQNAVVYLLDAASGKAGRRIGGPQSIIHHCAFSPDGRTIATAGNDGTVRLWEVVTGEQRLRLRGHEDVVMSCTFSPDGKTLASAGLDRTVRLWDLATGEEIRKVRGPQGRVYALAFSKGGKTLASGGEDTTVLLWDLEKVSKRE